MKKLLQQLCPPILWEIMHGIKNAWRRKPVEHHATIGNFRLVFPIHSLIPALSAAQTHRDLAVGICAKLIGAKYPDACMLDIGANVGDTAAMMASYCSNKLVLVDPSDTYAPYLKRNTSLFSNPVELVKGIVAGEEKVHGTLVHEGGTARILKGDADSVDFTQFTLSELGEGKSCFIKIDTDGFDYEIIQSSGEFLRRVHPAVYWEGEVSSRAELEAADATVNSLSRWGYTLFAVWDDPGFFILSTGEVSVIKQMHRYLYEIGKHSYRRSIYNYNIAAFHEADGDVARAVVEHFQRINES